jgi:DNA-3-methyladenine glycosylase II
MRQAEYWNQACHELGRRDPLMKQLTRAYAGANLRSRGNAFETLLRAIVGQQISIKAADAVWQRLTAFTAIKPEVFHAHSVDQLRGCGLSRRKAEYCLDLARHFCEGRIRPKRWLHMDDEAIIEELTDVRGIGRWTAEMFLIFHLLRPNVWPVDDLGLLRALSLHYAAGEKITPSRAREMGEAWAPWRTVATWYLWRSLDPVAVEY